MKHGDLVKALKRLGIGVSAASRDYGSPLPVLYEATPHRTPSGRVVRTFWMADHHLTITTALTMEELWQYGDLGWARKSGTATWIVNGLDRVVRHLTRDFRAERIDALKVVFSAETYETPCGLLRASMHLNAAGGTLWAHDYLAKAAWSASLARSFVREGMPAVAVLDLLSEKDPKVAEIIGRLT